MCRFFSYSSVAVGDNTLSSNFSHTMPDISLSFPLMLSGNVVSHINFSYPYDTISELVTGHFNMHEFLDDYHVAEVTNYIESIMAEGTVLGHQLCTNVLFNFNRRTP